MSAEDGVSASASSSTRRDVGNAGESERQLGAFEFLCRFKPGRDRDVRARAIRARASARAKIEGAWGKW
jgi:hypothetical protein